MTYKKILCLDFDGVIHSYASGWKGAAIIPDSVVPGAIEFIYKAVEHFTVAIHSSRSGQPGGIEAMQGALKMWLYTAVDDIEDAKRVFAQIQWPTEKPPAFLTIDDRAMTFTGVWPDMDTLKAFEPWNKKKK